METFSAVLTICAGTSSVNSPQHKGQWRGALMFNLICSWINDWENNGETGDLRRHRPHYDVTVMRHCWASVNRGTPVFLSNYSWVYHKKKKSLDKYWLDILHGLVNFRYGCLFKHTNLPVIVITRQHEIPSIFTCLFAPSKRYKSKCLLWARVWIWWNGGS